MYQFPGLISLSKFFVSTDTVIQYINHFHVLDIEPQFPPFYPIFYILTEHTKHQSEGYCGLLSSLSLTFIQLVDIYILALHTT